MTNRVFIINLGIGIAVFSLFIRLLYIQVIDDEYKTAAQKNILRKNIEYSYRGLIYDIDDSLLVYNAPIFDLMVIPDKIDKGRKGNFCDLLGITYEEYEKKIQKGKNYSSRKPSIFLSQLPDNLFARLQDRLVEFPGFYVVPRTIRNFNTQSMGNVLGYIGEVSIDFLRKKDTANFYTSGDYVGLDGIEKSYEKSLRGKQGVTYNIVDVRGDMMKSFEDGEYDILPEPGQKINITIDLDLQQYAEKLMKGKIGSVVAIEPSSGRVIALVSAPSYDPSLLNGKNLGKNYTSLLKNPDRPLFNRAIQAQYPPGSMFKAVQGLIALQEGVITPHKLISTKIRHIGDLSAPGFYNLKKALIFSSNNYFYTLMKLLVEKGERPSPFQDARLGLEQWNKYVKTFGVGDRIGIDLPGEAKGNVPSVSTYDKMYGINRWKYSNVASLSIGQGELLVTPLQMANLATIIANRGYYISPHVVARINNFPNPIIKKHYLEIDKEHYVPIIKGLEEAVQYGSGKNAYLKGLYLCGKTSTVQNPRGRDHSGFVGFAPKNNSKIAIATYVENAGGGGRAASIISSLLVEKYLRDSISRPHLENYIIKKRYLKRNVIQPDAQN